MFESNYPAVTKALELISKTMDAQVAKYPNQPLFINVKTYPSVLNHVFGNQTLDQTVTAISLTDVFVGYAQNNLNLHDRNPAIEPAAMTRESVDRLMLDIGGRNTSIPKGGTSLLSDFFFGIYGRRSDAIVTRILHPESIVSYILTGEPLKGIWERAKSDMITQSISNYPVVSKFNVEAFKRYMATLPADADVNEIMIGGNRFRINLNNLKVDASGGGIFDRNSNTFGTWSTFPTDGDYLYGINIAGTVLGILDNQLTGADRVTFKSRNWEKRIRFLCVAATMNSYVFSYLFDYALKK